MSVIEKMARVIFDHAIGPQKWDNPFYQEERDGCHFTAKAVLAAALEDMREPSDQMLESSGTVAGFDEQSLYDEQRDGEYIGPDHAHIAWWQAMLDQYRKENLSDE